MNDFERRRKEKAKLDYEALMKVYPLTLLDLPGEEWKPFPDYEELYHVSNYGRVKSFYLGKPTIRKPQINNLGYLLVILYKNGKWKLFRIHRLVAICFIPNPENKPEINHIDGNPLNNHVSNLEWCTRTENIRHAFDAGLAKQGEARHSAKLNNQQVLYIRNNPDNLSQQKLGKMFGVEQTTIGLIQRGETYKTAGGIIHKAREQTPRLPDEVRNQIRSEYVHNSREFGTTALAKKYGVNPVTIWNIIHEQR